MRAALRPGYRLAAKVRRLYWFVFRPQTFGVKTVVVHDGRWLMVRNTYGNGYWTFPGGSIDRGEAPPDAAMREVREEVGIGLGDVTPIGDYFSDLEYKRDTVYCFRADVTSPGVTIDEGEILEAGWFAPHELPAFHGASVDLITDMMEQA